MKKLQSWAVAAAILLRRGSSMHFTTISNEIEKSELTSLGLKGDTPDQTIGAVLRKHIDIFTAEGDGYYGITNENTVRSDRFVQMALEGLSGKEKNKVLLNLLRGRLHCSPKKMQS
jgi:hypothetical protein